MTDKFKPLNYNPRLVYGADYWSIVGQDTNSFGIQLTEDLHGNPFNRWSYYQILW
jgi:hypothetical protein